MMPIWRLSVAGLCCLLSGCGSDSSGSAGASGGANDAGVDVADTGGTGGTGGSGGTSPGGTGGSPSGGMGGSPSGGMGGGTGGSSTGGTGAEGGAAGHAGAGGGSHPSCAQVAAGPYDGERQVPGINDRAYDLHIPPSYSCNTAAPVVLALHGGGGRKEDAAVATCPSDDPQDRPTDLLAPGCMNQLANEKGFVIVYANGTDNDRPAVSRTFNAGGGQDGYTCVSGYACTEAVDETVYFDALLDDLETVIHVDPSRVFATGMSNGAAMSHALACKMSGRIAAIAPVAGGNQLVTSEPCTPSRPVPVLHIHGTSDPCWPYLGGPAGCLASGDMVGRPDDPSLVLGPSTIAGWVARNNCDTTPTTTNLPNPNLGDGLVREIAYPGCDQGADVVLYSIVGGGHTWPGGYRYNPLVGVVNRDINASEVILDFFAAHPMP